MNSVQLQPPVADVRVIARIINIERYDDPILDLSAKCHFL